MNPARFIAAFIILTIFSLRITLPLLIHNAAGDEEVISQQEDSSRDKSPEKPIHEMETWLPDHFSLSLIVVLSGNLFGLLVKPALPERYSTIPTPPPWAKS